MFVPMPMPSPKVAACYSVVGVVSCGSNYAQILSAHRNTLSAVCFVTYAHHADTTVPFASTAVGVVKTNGTAELGVKKDSDPMKKPVVTTLPELSRTRSRAKLRDPSGVTGRLAVRKPLTLTRETGRSNERQLRQKGDFLL